jgi:hypothetical protein
MSPDLISLVSTADATPTTNTLLAVGDQVSVLGAPCDARYREEAVLALTGPRHYGFDFDYSPIESIMEAASESEDETG